MEKPPKLCEYDGKGDSHEHIQIINDQLNYFITDKASKCKFFTLTLVGPTRMWFNGLLNRSIESWTDFCEEFFAYFTAHKRW